MNRIPEAVTRFALMSFGFRFAAILLVFALFAGCGRTTNLDLEVEWLAAPGAEKQMLTIRSHEQRPLVIKRITVNGEVTVQEILNGLQSEHFRETTLTIGEATTYIVDYSKRILYADIITDRGTTRYEFNQVEPQ
ncbi:MAG TPA: hypothetical protein VGW57_15490 [Chthoniobacterales bacterium]|nr:hypothetical protein [Chthoniobacterales bacterium]